MNTILKTDFDFRTGNQKFAAELYGKWEFFSRTCFEEVADRIFSRFDTAETIFTIPLLNIDLGNLSEENFYHQFPQRFAEKLEKELSVLFRHLPPGKIDIRPEDEFRQLLFWLRHGYTSWDSSEMFHAAPSVRRALEKDGDRLLRFILNESNGQALHQRLIYQLDDELLEKLATLTEPAESPFIVRYTRFLAGRQQFSPSSLTRTDYRQVVWRLIFAYLWHPNHSYFSRREMVRYTLNGLAAHFGIGMQELLQLMYNGMQQLSPAESVVHELTAILNDLSAWAGLLSSQPAPGKAEIPAFSDPSDFFDPSKRREILSRLTEEEVYRLTGKISPEENTYIISYAQTLEQKKERGLFEGRAGSEFRLLKWEFIFETLLNAPAGKPSRLEFVCSVLQKLAAHYGLDYFLLLDYFHHEKETAPPWLNDILAQLYTTAAQQTPRQLLQAISDDHFSVQRQQFLVLIHHPQSCRELLSQLPEKEIHRLTRIFFPHESSFINTYVGHLQQQEHGLLAGKAGSDFRLLTWEFIFRVALSGTFNRKRFALEVLQQLSAHYSIPVPLLLEYLYHNLPGNSHANPPEIIRLICELHKESLPRTPSRLTPERSGEIPPRNAPVPLPAYGIAGSLPAEQATKTSSRVLLTIHNTGLVLIAPWLPRLFSILQLTDEQKKFHHPECRLRAIFLLQGILYDEPDKEFEEHELFLNRLLTGCPPDVPLPRQLILTPEERQTTADMLKGILCNWPKMKNTTPQAFRDSFLIREGQLEDKGNSWHLTAAPRGYDVLLGSLPWSYTPVKLPWIEKNITVRI